MSIKISNFLILSLIFINTTLNAQAQVTHYINPGQEPLVANGLIASLGDGDKFNVLFAPTYSYCCYLSANYIDPIIEFESIKDIFTDTNIQFTSRGDNMPAVNRAGSNNSGRACFIAPSGNSNINADITVNVSTSGQALNVKARCDETTLFGGFNTLTGEFNFLELQNTLSPDFFAPGIAGNIKLKDSISGHTINVPFSISNGDRNDIALHGRFPSAAFGSVIISHDGPPGALKAETRFYNRDTNTVSGLVPVSKDTFTVR